MTFKEFLQDRWVFLLGQTIFLLFAGVLLRLLRVSGFTLGFLAFLYLALMLVTLGVEFYRKKTFFDQMFQLLDSWKRNTICRKSSNPPILWKGRS